MKVAILTVGILGAALGGAIAGAELEIIRNPPPYYRTIQGLDNLNEFRQTRWAYEEEVNDVNRNLHLMRARQLEDEVRLECREQSLNNMNVGQFNGLALKLVNMRYSISTAFPYEDDLKTRMNQTYIACIAALDEELDSRIASGNSLPVDKIQYGCLLATKGSYCIPLIPEQYELMGLTKPTLNLAMMMGENILAALPTWASDDNDQAENIQLIIDCVSNYVSVFNPRLFAQLLNFTRDYIRPELRRLLAIVFMNDSRLRYLELEEASFADQLHFVSSLIENILAISEKIAPNFYENQKDYLLKVFLEIKTIRRANATRTLYDEIQVECEAQTIRNMDIVQLDEISTKLFEMQKYALTSFPYNEPLKNEMLSTHNTCFAALDTEVTARFDSALTSPTDKLKYGCLLSTKSSQCTFIEKDLYEVLGLAMPQSNTLDKMAVNVIDSMIVWANSSGIEARNIQLIIYRASEFLSKFDVVKYNSMFIRVDEIMKHVYLNFWNKIMITDAALRLEALKVNSSHYNFRLVPFFINTLLEISSEVAPRFYADQKNFFLNVARDFQAVQLAKVKFPTVEEVKRAKGRKQRKMINPIILAITGHPSGKSLKKLSTVFYYDNLSAQFKKSLREIAPYLNDTQYNRLVAINALPAKVIVDKTPSFFSAYVSPSNEKKVPKTELKIDAAGVVTVVDNGHPESANKPMSTGVKIALGVGIGVVIITAASLAYYFFA